MMRLNSKHLACLVLIFGFHSAAQSYETETHKVLSDVAANDSDSLDDNLSNLGLSSLDNKLTAEGLKCNWKTPTTNTALEWIQEGSVCEDDTFTESFARYKHHFYDLQHDGKGFGGFLNSGFMSGKPAPDWALDMGPADGQLYSFSQGRQYF